MQWIETIDFVDSTDSIDNGNGKEEKGGLAYIFNISY
jgi:hypothetical protein